LEVDQNEYIPDAPSFEGVDYHLPPPPPYMDEYSPDPTQSLPSVPSGGTSTSHGSKRKAPMVDYWTHNLTSLLQGLMDSWM